MLPRSWGRALRDAATSRAALPHGWRWRANVSPGVPGLNQHCLDGRSRSWGSALMQGAFRLAGLTGIVARQVSCCPSAG